MCGIFACLGPTTRKWAKDFKDTSHRGPDNTTVLDVTNNLTIGFHRLSINDPSDSGNQPFVLDDDIYLIVNGEIYNHEELTKTFKLDLKSKSDCEVIIHLYKLFDYDFYKVITLLDGVYAMFLYHKSRDRYFVARDMFGIRPLYFITTPEHKIYSSEFRVANSMRPYKAIHFPPRSYYDSKDNIVFKTHVLVDHSPITDLSAEPLNKINELLTSAVIKRITNTDQNIGFFLSGGFDSSIVAAIAANYFKKKSQIHTFSIGFEDSNDFVHAQQVAKHINSIHHEVIITHSDAINAIPHVIRSLETFDTTTIRASTPMWLLSRYIRQNYPDIKVMLSGEGADEYGSYEYFKNAPSEIKFYNESVRLFDQIHLFDVLRSDRCTAAHSLELRVPFLDPKFYHYFTKIDTKYRMPHNNLTKYYLRKAFDTIPSLLPQSVLYRPKDAFSDSVGNKWRIALINHTNSIYSDDDLAAAESIEHLPPRTKEELWYREIFNSIFDDSIALDILPNFWHPKWQKNNLVDPSATQLQLT